MTSRAPLKGILCPACGLRCVLRINADFAECPDHGRFSGMLLMQTKGMEPWEALLEIRTEQTQDWVRGSFRHLESWLYNDSFLKISIAYIV